MTKKPPYYFNRVVFEIKKSNECFPCSYNTTHSSLDVK